MPKPGLCAGRVGVAVGETGAPVVGTSAGATVGVGVSTSADPLSAFTPFPYTIAHIPSAGTCAAYEVMPPSSPRQRVDWTVQFPPIRKARATSSFVYPAAVQALFGTLKVRSMPFSTEARLTTTEIVR